MSPLNSKIPLTIACAPGIRTNGERIAGTVICEIPLEDVTSLSIILCGEVTVLDHSSRHTSGLRYDQADFVPPVQTILRAERKLWPPPSTSSESPAESRSPKFSFSFRLPLQTAMPASFQFLSGRTEGFVRYYLKARLTRKGWFRRSTNVTFVFPFLPSVPPELDPSWRGISLDWSGEWKVTEVVDIPLRKGIFSSGKGITTVQLLLPSTSALPLFTPIPLRIRLICKSKTSDTTASPRILKSSGPPILPSITDIDLDLIQHCRTSVFVVQQTLEQNLGRQASFGKAPRLHNTGLTSKVPWGQEIREERGVPSWVEGDWVQEVTYSSKTVFHSAPPFETNILGVSLSLRLTVRYPGLKTSVQLSTGPLSVTSGFSARGGTSMLDVPPPFSEHELDLPPSYFVTEVQEEEN